MGCFNIYIYNRQGTCLYYYEWSRPKSVKQGAGTPADDQKMMFGLFFSLKTFAAAMDPRTESKSQLGAPLRIGDSCTFQSFRTNNYKLHFLESPSGFKIVLNTDANAGDLRDNLSYIYGLYVEYVMKNPLYTPGEPFRCDLFTWQLQQYVKSLPT
ncbi:g12035 [Coccomyxa viridis]|uniref:Trafficking protein particle complex subunit n=1 Tax=Coccomyxa viridis TaxID=1274662 RepID=A0ABP1GAH8_9CHLO